MAAVSRVAGAVKEPTNTRGKAGEVCSEAATRKVANSQVLELIADGLTNRQIGEKLALAEKTIKNYVSGLLAKLGMERRTQAAVYGAQNREEDDRRATS